MAISDLDDDKLETIEDEEEAADVDEPGWSAKSSGLSATQKVLIVVAVVGVVLIGACGLVVLLVAIAFDPNAAQPPVAGGAAPRKPHGEILAPAPPKQPAAWPPLGPAREIEPGVVVHEVFLQPGAESSKLWLYLPAKVPDKLPCLLIGPAGSPPFLGMNLGDGDRPEHLPYVRAGFAVVAYAISGACDLDKATKDQLRASFNAFRAAEGGVLNARNALDFALARVPQIDPQRICTAGHSSAGTLSLLVAMKERRIKRCVAFAPVTDPVGRLRNELSRLETRIPGLTGFLLNSSLRLHARELFLPVFIFQAKDDDNVPIRETEQFVRLLRSANPAVTFATVASGGHYDAMIKEGIPQAIQWLQGSAKAK